MDKVFIDLVPTLTSNTSSPDIEVGYYTPIGYLYKQPYLMFDKNHEWSDDHMASVSNSFGDYTGAYFYIKFLKKKTKVYSAFVPAINTCNAIGTKVNIIIEGSNDGINWDPITIEKEYSHTVYTEEKMFSINCSAYSYFRVRQSKFITGTQYGFAITELYLYGS